MDNLKQILEVISIPFLALLVVILTILGVVFYGVWIIAQLVKFVLENEDQTEVAH